MKRKQLFFILFLICWAVVPAKEYHVSVKGNDANEGTEKAPFRTIGKAAEYAFPSEVFLNNKYISQAATQWGLRRQSRSE